MKIMYFGEDPIIEDITEEVKMMFDSLLSSMYSGSGFLSTDEMKNLIKVGELLNVTDDENFLDLKADFLSTSGAHSEEHEFDPDRHARNEWSARCKLCGHVAKNLQRHGIKLFTELELDREREIQARREANIRANEESLLALRKEFDYYLKKGLLPPGTTYEEVTTPRKE